MWAPLLCTVYFSRVKCTFTGRNASLDLLRICPANCAASDFGKRCHLAEQFLEMEIDTDTDCLLTHLTRLTPACHCKSIVQPSRSDYPNLDLSFFPLNVPQPASHRWTDQPFHSWLDKIVIKRQLEAVSFPSTWNRCTQAFVMLWDQTIYWWAFAGNATWQSQLRQFVMVATRGLGTHPNCLYSALWLLMLVGWK